MTLKVELVSAEGRVWDGDAKQVIAKTTEGDLGILTGHAPLIGIVVEGQVRIDGEAGQVLVDVDGGMLSVDHDRVIIAAEVARVASGTR